MPLSSPGDLDTGIKAVAPAKSLELQADSSPPRHWGGPRSLYLLCLIKTILSRAMEFLGICTKLLMIFFFLTNYISGIFHFFSTSNLKLVNTAEL